jgi:hypothetical protein
MVKSLLSEAEELEFVRKLALIPHKSWTRNEICSPGSMIPWAIRYYADVFDGKNTNTFGIEHDRGRGEYQAHFNFRITMGKNYRSVRNEIRRQFESLERRYSVNYREKQRDWLKYIMPRITP